MQITKITLVEGLQGCDIILLIIILIIYTAIFFCLKESKKINMMKTDLLSHLLLESYSYLFLFL